MYELVFGSQQPKAKAFRNHCCNAMFPRIRQQLTNKMKGDHQQSTQVVTIKYRPLSLQTKTLITSQQIGTQPAMDILTTCCVSSKRIAKKFIHTTLFDVNTGSLFARPPTISIKTAICGKTTPSFSLSSFLNSTASTTHHFRKCPIWRYNFYKT